MTPKSTPPVACDAWETGGWDRGHALAGSVGLGEAGLGWGGSLYWVARGWDPMWGWWGVCQRQGGVGWGVDEGGVVVGVWSCGVGGEGVPCKISIAARRSHGKTRNNPQEIE